MSDTQVEVNGDIHRIGNNEYTRGRLGSFNIYTLKIKDLFIEETYYKREGIENNSILKGTAYIPTTMLDGYWIPNPIKEVEVSIYAFSKDDIEDRLDIAVEKVRNDFNKETLGYYRFDRDRAIGACNLRIDIFGGRCNLDLEYSLYDTLIKSLQAGSIADLEVQVKMYSIFTSTDLTKGKEIQGYLLVKDGESDGKTDGLVLEMNLKTHAKELNIEKICKIEHKNAEAKVIEANIVNLNAQLLKIRKIALFGFITLGVLGFFGLFI